MNKKAKLFVRICHYAPELSYVSINGREIPFRPYDTSLYRTNPDDYIIRAGIRKELFKPYVPKPDFYSVEYEYKIRGGVKHFSAMGGSRKVVCEKLRKIRMPAEFLKENSLTEMETLTPEVRIVSVRRTY